MPRSADIRTDLCTDFDRALALLRDLQQGLWGKGFTIRHRRRSLRCRPARTVDFRLVARADGPRRSLTIRLTWPAPAPAPTNRDRHPPVEARTLRRRFRNALDHKDFQAAIELGAQITEHYPDSAMARQFAKLRPTLTRRASSQE